MYSERLFFQLDDTTSSEWFKRGILAYNKTPPYLIAEPSVEYMDLSLYCSSRPTLILFTDGIDNLVHGNFVFHQDMPCRAEPEDVVGALLEDRIDPYIEVMLGHTVESKWLGPDGNRSVEVLGNLLGGLNSHRLTMTMDPKMISPKEKRRLYIDDTTLLVFRLFDRCDAQNEEIETG